MTGPLIAVIEDDEAVLAMIAECLAVEGYRTLTYRQGAGAYELIEQWRPDAVVLDIRLEHPRAGLSVLQRLRHDVATATIPALICTADIPFIREWARTLSGYGCMVIAKPFDIAALIAAVAHLVGSSPADPMPGNGGDARAKGSPERTIRPVVGLVDVDGKGVTAHTAQLEQKGYKVVACRWGDGVFDMAVCEQPDMLLVDPGDRSRGAVSFALRRLERHPLTGHIPVVVDPQRDGEVDRLIEQIVGPAPAITRARAASHRRA